MNVRPGVKATAARYHIQLAQGAGNAEPRRQKTLPGHLRLALAS
jgi:hypothetical protein